MQKTNFPFEAIVHDDASTDGSAAIIREYAEKYPDIIKPIYETENQYSKHDGSLARVMDAAMHPNSKYVAICEGDDYWIDPNKLQLQVDFLENNSEYAMCCNKSRTFSEKKQIFTNKIVPSTYSGTLRIRDIITRGGLFISTCSLVFRKSVNSPDYPDYCRKCHVGDYPLQIMCAMKGKVYCIDRLMSVYRVDHPGSWCVVQNGYNVEKTIKTRRSEVEMLKGFALDYPQYKKLFNGRIAYYINMGIPMDKSRDAVEISRMYTRGATSIYLNFVNNNEFADYFDISKTNIFNTDDPDIIKFGIASTKGG